MATAMTIGDDNGVVEVDVDRFGIMLTWTQPQRALCLELPDLSPEEAILIARMLIAAAEEFQHGYCATRPHPAPLLPA